jgi:hypothetical protein
VREEEVGGERRGRGGATCSHHCYVGIPSHLFRCVTELTKKRRRGEEERRGEERRRGERRRGEEGREKKRRRGEEERGIKQDQPAAIIVTSALQAIFFGVLQLVLAGCPHDPLLLAPQDQRSPLTS